MKNDMPTCWIESDQVWVGITTTTSCSINSNRSNSGKVELHNHWVPLHDAERHVDDLSTIVESFFRQLGRARRGVSEGQETRTGRY